MTKKILVAGLNPAWQSTMVFERFQPFEVNRAVSVKKFASGKGINCARAIINWGGQAVVHQFTGGRTGEGIAAGLDEWRIPHHSTGIGGESRSCHTCLCRETRGMTELIEPSGTVSAAERQRALDALLQALDGADGVAICGTYPLGVGEDFPAAVAASARNREIPLLIDGWREVGKAFAAGIDIVKINAEELEKLTGESDARNGVKQLAARFSPKIIAVTGGAENAWLMSESRLYHFIPPKINLVNPLGAGDTASAVLLLEILNGAAPVQAFAAAIAAASASCETMNCADYDKNRALELLDQVKITPP